MSDSRFACIERVHQGLLEAGLDPKADAADEDLCAGIRGLHALVNSAEALQASLLAEVGRRAELRDQEDAAETGFNTGRHSEFVTDEIAVLLATTASSAGYLYDRAVRTGASPSVMAAWRAGRIDGRKAASIAHTYAVCGEDAPADVMDSVIDAAVEYAQTHTPPEVRQWLRRRELSLNPAAAERRRQEALAERRVAVIQGDDGMSDLRATMTSVDARRIHDVLSHMAQSLGSKDPRSMDQRRLDCLTDLLLGRTQPPSVDLHVVVSSDTLAGSSDAPGWIPGLGPITAIEARALANTASTTSQARFKRLVVAPISGTLTDLSETGYRPSKNLNRAVRMRDVTCRFPGCRKSALNAGTDLDHATPWPTGPTAATNLAVLCRRHHRLKHTPGWNVELDADGTMRWTTPGGQHYTTTPWHYTDGNDPPPEQPPP